MLRLYMSITFLGETYQTVDEFIKYIENEIKSGNNLNIKDDETDSTMLYILVTESQGKHLDIIAKLIRSGADINLQTDGMTVLMYTSINSSIVDCIETTKLLIELGADVNVQNKCGMSALMLATKYSNIGSSVETVKILIDAGADLNMKNDVGRTALILASLSQSESSSTEVINLLIDAGSDLNIMDDDGNTCLHYLLRYSDSLDIINTIISKGCSINHTTKVKMADKIIYSNSLLHLCAIGIKEKHSNYDILTFLETLDIDKTLKNSDGKTYLDYLGINYHVVSRCQMCSTTESPITILNCSCNCGKQCLNCTRKTDKCYYCNSSFRGFKIIRLI